MLSRWRRRHRTPGIVTPSGLVPHIGVKGAFYTDAARTTSKYMEHTFAVTTLLSEPHEAPAWADHDAHLDTRGRGKQTVLTLPLWAWWWAYAPAGPLEFWVEWRRFDAE